MKVVKLPDLRPADFEKAWLWQFVPAEDDGVLRLKPVNARKATNKFDGRAVGTSVTLADGSRLPALIEGLSLDVPEFSKHNRQLTLWIEEHGWFQLAQYFTNEELQSARGPQVLCDLLGKKLSQVFPICFDIRDRSNATVDCLSGTFEPAPSWGVTQEQVMDILLRELD